MCCLGSLQSGAQWITFVVFVVFALGGMIWLSWKRISVVTYLKRFENAEFLLGLIEALSAGAVGAVATGFKVWTKDMWGQHPVQAQYAILLVSAGTFIVFFGKWARDKVKDRDKEKVQELTAELQQVTLRLDRFRRLGAQIRGLIQRKIVRARKVAKKASPTVEDMLIPSERETQVHTIIASIYEFFMFELQGKRPEGRMRIGLYFPNADHTKLIHAYSFDGENRNCFQDNSEWMQLNSPKGISSEIVRVYHAEGDQKLLLVPDCSTHPNFTFFRPEQRDYLKSMLIFKYLVQLDGAASALMLSIDCDEPNFFGKDRYDEISEFLVEMLKGTSG